MRRRNRVRATAVARTLHRFWESLDIATLCVLVFLAYVVLVSIASLLRGTL